MTSERKASVSPSLRSQQQRDDCRGDQQQGYRLGNGSRFAAERRTTRAVVIFPGSQVRCAKRIGRLAPLPFQEVRPVYE